ncbi:hypothetical protein M0R45_019266 [Rubus argutus]|uniref:Uncharacterized protein n=1 Tax=Rubus argutus TaxID=59490 RepID=A0AAW1X5C8_RUBAR
MAIATKLTRASPIMHVLCFAHPAPCTPKAHHCLANSAHDNKPQSPKQSSQSHPHHGGLPKLQIPQQNPAITPLYLQLQSPAETPRLCSIQLYQEAASTAKPTWFRASAQP